MSTAVEDEKQQQQQKSSPHPPSVADLLLRNHTHLTTGTWSARPLLSQLLAQGTPPPTIVIITCCDIRCHPSEFLHLHPSEALVLRNIGGHIRGFLPDIATLDTVIGLTEIMIVHHTDCGATYYTDEMIRDAVNARRGGVAGTVDERTWFGAIADLEQSLRENVALARASSWIREELKECVYGYLFDIQTGRVKRVDDCH